MQTNNKSLQILAINPGWRYLGIAIFNDLDLSEWRIKVLSGKGAKEKMRKLKEILRDLFARHDLNTLAIKEVHPSRSSANLTNLTNEIKTFCREKRLKVCAYSIKDLEVFFGPGERINKRQLAEHIVSEYPALEYELRHEQRNRNPYFIRLFEAVALGLVCSHKMKADNY